MIIREGKDHLQKFIVKYEVLMRMVEISPSFVCRSLHLDDIEV
jgi:hypothetical protein